MAAPDPVPFGLNFLVGPKGFNNLDRKPSSGSMEPEFVREMAYVDEVGTADGKAWFSSSRLAQNRDYADGYWDGATARIYRPEGDTTWRRIGTGRVQRYQGMRQFAPVSGGPSFFDGDKRLTDFVIRAEAGPKFADGRLCEFYQQTDLFAGVPYLYSVRTIDDSGRESADPNVVQATPDRALDSGPRIMTWAVDAPRETGGKSGKGRGGRAFTARLEATGGAEPLQWDAAPETLPAGLTLGTEMIAGRTKGVLSGQPAATDPVWFTVRVTDAKGRTDERAVGFGLSDPPGAGDAKARKKKAKKNAPAPVAPDPPRNVRAQPLATGVALAWEPSPTPGVAGYKVYRSRHAPDDQASRVVVEGADAAPQPGDLVFLVREILWSPPESFHETRLFRYWERSPYQMFFKRPDGKDWDDWKSLDSLAASPKATVRRVAHRQPLPAAFAADADAACLELACESGWGVGLGLFKHAGRDQEFYNVYLPGRTYRFQAWMRQEGVPEGRVTLADPGVPEVEQTFAATGEWRLFTRDFTPARWLENPRISQTRLTIEGGGKLWLDTPIVFDATDADGNGQPDVPPGGFKPAWEQELRRFFAGRDTRRGVLRFWGAQSNGPGGTTLADYLLPPNRCRDTAGDASLALGQFLALCARVRADPWLIVSVTWAEDEWRGLVEYLAAGPETPYGQRRTADRGGDPTPWTATFGQVFIEYDNETWNGSFHWNFKGRDGVANDRATEYGAFAELMFRAAKSHPAWAAAKLDDKVRFIVNGWNGQQDENGYGAMAAKAAPSAAFADVAPYLGGWEQRAFLGGTTFTDEGVNQWLLYLPWRHQGQVDAHTATARLLRDQKAANYRLAVYEGGPGYDLPSPSNPAGVVPESYGKSLAAAVTTLDCYLHESLKGYGPQAFFGFRPGTRWSSHVQILADNGEQVVPQTVFHALELRNLGMQLPPVGPAGSANKPCFTAPHRRGMPLKRNLLARLEATAYPDCAIPTPPGYRSPCRPNPCPPAISPN